MIKVPFSVFIEGFVKSGVESTTCLWDGGVKSATVPWKSVPRGSGVLFGDLLRETRSLLLLKMLGGLYIDLCKDIYLLLGSLL